MGTIQNQFNQALAASLGSTLMIGHATAGIRELQSAQLGAKGAAETSKYYSDIAAQGRQELKGVFNEQQLQDWESEYGSAEALAQAASQDSLKAQEQLRQTQLKYGTTAQKKAAVTHSDTMSGSPGVDRLLESQGYGTAEKVEQMRAQFKQEAADREAAFKHEQARQEEITSIQTAYEERMKTLKEAATRRYTESLAADAKMAILKREMEDLKSGK